MAAPAIGTRFTHCGQTYVITAVIGAAWVGHDVATGERITGVGMLGQRGSRVSLASTGSQIRALRLQAAAVPGVRGWLLRRRLGRIEANMHRRRAAVIRHYVRRG